LISPGQTTTLLSPAPNLPISYYSFTIFTFIQLIMQGFKVAPHVLVSLFMAVLTVADGTTTTSYTDDDSFRNDLMNVTNEHRVQHNASRLEWNTTLAEYAQDWADGCQFEHSVSFISQMSKFGRCSRSTPALLGCKLNDSMTRG
jgi:hypothetical protein